MGRVAIATENRTNEGGSGFPSVKLTEKGQKTRFTLIEKPWREYVHYIKSPKFNEDGTPKKEKKTKKNGEEYTDTVMDLVGTEICLGDPGTLAEKGVDEGNCPACEASVKSGGDIPGPIQRFAVNVVEYVTTPAGGIKKPFSASIKIWKFTGRIYDEIEGIQQEIGDLRKHDITLECEDPYWNRNKLAFKMEPGYQSAPPGYLKELLSTPGNRATDAQLKDACGRDVPRARMEEDCAFALRQFRKLRNEGGGAVPEEFTSKAPDLSGGIDELLGEENPNAAAEQDMRSSAQAGATDDPFAEFAGSSAQAAPEKEPASGSASPSPAREPAETTALPSEDDDPFEAGTASASPGAAPAQESAPPSEPAGDFDFDNLLDGIG